MDSAKTNFIERATSAHTPESEALQQLTGRERNKPSESAVINELIQLGIAKVQEEAAMTGYTALAAEQQTEEDRAFEQAARRNTRRTLTRS